MSLWPDQGPLTPYAKAENEGQGLKREAVVTRPWRIAATRLYALAKPAAAFNGPIAWACVWRCRRCAKMQSRCLAASGFGYQRYAVMLG